MFKKVFKRVKLKIKLLKIGVLNQKKVRNFDFEYSWRGLHLDVARHAVSLQYLYSLIDKLSENNLNRLHLHLTDDQGWRIEIEKYPLLHEKGSVRKETVIEKNFPTPWIPFTKYKGDKKEYKFYYTKQELKALDRYAKEKGVTIVPEIDIPGHVTAMLYAYPEYSAGKAPKKVETYWGIFPNVVKDDSKTINFLKDIFDELIEVFSGEYIHIGGDEVPLKNYDGDKEKYNRVLREIALYLKSKNKKVIMWEDAFEVALETNSILMCWQDIWIGKDFIKKGGSAIFCPANYLYLDYYQSEKKTEPLAIGGYIPLEKIYNFKLEEELGYNFFNKHEKQILGVQANLWTEYLNTEEKVNYMLFPRFYALAEVANRSNNNFKKFKNKLKEEGRL